MKKTISLTETSITVTYSIFGLVVLQVEKPISAIQRNLTSPV